MIGEHETSDREVLPPIQLRWDAARTERALGAVHGRLRDRKRARNAALALSCAAAIALASLAALRSQQQRSELATNSPAHTVDDPLRDGSRVVRFKEGSSVKLETKESELSVLAASDDSIDVELKRGLGHFDVASKTARSFTVRTGPVTVRSLGAEFRVQVLGAAASVEVTRGLVSVSWDGGAKELAVGERGVFPPPDGAHSAAVAENVDAPQTAEADGDSGRTSQNPKPKADEFRTLAKQRDYKAAYKILVATPTAVGQSASDLLLAADVARLSGHPAEAVPYLERLLASHSKSSEAPLAAFTLGRTLMGLGQSARAISAFARARALAPSGPLAEDALVRQVEAAANSGNRELASKLAEQYERAYPNGRKLPLVRGYTGQKQ